MGEHLIPVMIQALLALAVFSFLEYSIRTLHAPDVINRRAKIICAAGLTLGVLGVWTMMFHRAAGIAMTLAGNLVAVATMVWIDRYGEQEPPVPKPEPAEPANQADAANNTSGEGESEQQ